MLVDLSRTFLTDTVLGSFPFRAQPDRAMALAALLQPFARAHFGGPSPMYLVTGDYGVGKTSLAHVILRPIASSWRVTPSWPPHSLKSLQGMLLAAAVGPGDRYVFLDNLVRSGVGLVDAIGSRAFRLRPPRAPAAEDYPNDLLWIATAGPSATPAEDLLAVSAPIRLTAHRADHRRVDTIAWIERHHDEVHREATMLVAAWVDAKSPVRDVKACPLAERFPAWAAVMGGLLDFAGVAGFLPED